MGEKEISHMGKNNGNPDLVCDNHVSRWAIEGLLIRAVYLRPFDATT